VKSDPSSELSCIRSRAVVPRCGKEGRSGEIGAAEQGCIGGERRALARGVLGRARSLRGVVVEPARIPAGGASPVSLSWGVAAADAPWWAGRIWVA